jgi:hypothetical protein
MRVMESMSDAPYGGKTPSAAWYLALARAMKAAYAERLAGLGESEPYSAQSCTTHLTVCDAEGNTVAMTTTLMSSLGSRVLLPQSGVLLNNGMMWFDPRPGSPNSIAPGKRPLCNMLPVMLTESGRPYLAAGASGGRRIMAAVFQLMTFIADFGMSVEEAAHHPRIDITSFEAVINTRYTYDTLRFLLCRCPGVRFVWVMGADNLRSFSRWQRWRAIASLIPIAVEHHRRNKHHWEYWVDISDCGEIDALPIPDVYRREMLADWRGAGKSMGKPDLLGWYTKCRATMIFHPETRSWLEDQLGYHESTNET